MDSFRANGSAADRGGGNGCELYRKTGCIRRHGIHARPCATGFSGTALFAKSAVHLGTDSGQIFSLLLRKREKPGGAPETSRRMVVSVILPA